MNEEINVETLPKVLNAQNVADYLGISKAGAYNLMNSKSFPTLRIGKRLLVSADKFLMWIDTHSDNNEIMI